MAGDTSANQQNGGGAKLVCGFGGFRCKRPTGAAMLLGVRLRTAAARIGSGASPPPLVKEDSANYNNCN